MNTRSEVSLRAISDLAELSEFIPGGGAAGFPDDFAELFCQTEARLLRNTPRGSALGSIRVVVFRNKDLLEMAANPAVGMMPAEHYEYRRLFSNMVITTNPPVHGPMRQVIARSLAPKHVPRLRQVAEQVATGLIDEVVGQSDIEFGSQFGDRFTTRFWGAVFDMTEHEIECLIEIVHAITPVLPFASTPDEIAALNKEFDKYLELLNKAIHRALTQGGNELLESMACAFNAIEGESKLARLGEMIAANVIDGVLTVPVVGSNALYQLLLCPEALAAVRADLSLVSNAVAEGLRLWPPIIALDRYALRDLEFAETLIPRGTAISMLWAAGNRDPAVFEHPNRYDLFRKQRTETTFGGGVHICPGRYVVRMLANVMLEAVLARDIRIELTGEHPKWIASSSRQLNRMQVTVGRC